ncbi:MAG: AAA family ATPase [Candidatus Omnitrophica bacterium]|jgi:CO dehydrogenase maturation factor|nr:AAA family ATPase [Candidatus Omnitrophota bacterium]
MGHVILVAGKGGTGKTTISALLVRLLKEKKVGSVLAVDADPNSNLAETLGFSPKETIGSILNDISTHPEHIPTSMPKDRFIEYRVQSVIQEEEGFDLLTMGRPEGPGCYCYVNTVLRNVMEKLVNDYDYIIIDNEAGLEHLSRKITRSAEALVVVTQDTNVSLKAAARIRGIAKELDIRTKKNLLIINRTDKNIEQEKIKHLDLDYAGYVPEDEEITKMSFDGNSLLKLNSQAISIDALRKIGEKIWS